MIRASLWVFVVAGCALTTGGVGRVLAEPAIDVSRLIEELGHPDFKVRVSAGKSLSALGAEALPSLRRASEHNDLEVRRRVRDLLEPLEMAVLLAPKKVSLDLKRKPLKDAIASLRQQTGYKIEVGHGGPDNQVYNFNLKDMPFWEAVDRVCAVSGLVVQHGWGDDVLRIQAQESQVPFVHHAGLFRVVAEGFQHHRGIQFGQVPRNFFAPGQRSEYFSFSLSIASEPRLPLLGLGQVKVSAVVDDLNNSLMPAQFDEIAGHHFYGHYGRGLSMQTQINLSPPVREARSVKLLRGTIPVTLLVRQEPLIVVDNILGVKNKSFKAGSATLDIEEVRGTPEKSYQVKLTASETAKDQPNDHSWLNSVYQRLELRDAQGNKYQSQGNNWSNSTATSVRGTFTFGNMGNAKLGPPAKLVYNAWIKRQHHVPFEFQDLPLP